MPTLTFRDGLTVREAAIITRVVTIWKPKQGVPMPENSYEALPGIDSLRFRRDSNAALFKRGQHEDLKRSVSKDDVGEKACDEVSTHASTAPRFVDDRTSHLRSSSHYSLEPSSDNDLEGAASDDSICELVQGFPMRQVLSPDHHRRNQERTISWTRDLASYEERFNHRNGSNVDNRLRYSASHKRHLELHALRTCPNGLGTAST